MGHAAHFLRRLDRVSDGHVELALALYNDLELLREVLSRAGLPEGAERVAISLDDPIEGPFVVVTREGRFVTCLGAGMLVSDLPIVTRERLDAAAARVERMREELGRVRELRESGAEGQAGLAFTRMQQQGPRFAREDAETLLRVQPLIEGQCLREILELHVTLEKDVKLLASHRLDSPRRLAAPAKKHLLAFGDAVWGLAHLLVLIGSNTIRDRLERTDDEVGERESAFETIARLTFEWGTFTHVLRALWFVARGGKRALTAVKSLPSESFGLRMYRELALTAIALGSEKRRAEAQKALSAREVPEGGDPLEQLSAFFAVQGHALIESPAAHEARFFAMSREYAAQALHRRREVTAEECAAVPDDVARLAFITSQQSVFHSAAIKPVFASMCALPWLVRASPAELFLPAEWTQHLLQPRSVEDVINWFVPYAKARHLMPERAPRRVEAAPGRNDPCPCGSGKKHKRCCGAR